jgi:Rap1a immunity proteins
MKVLLSVALVCTLAGSLQAVDSPSDSGKDFLRLCTVIDKNHREQTPLEELENMSCVGYIHGLSNGVEVGIEFAKGQNGSVPEPYCLPPEVEIKQLVRVVLKYIKAHPETAHKPTAYLAMAALQQAFPCR